MSVPFLVAPFTGGLRLSRPILPGNAIAAQRKGAASLLTPARVNIGR